MTPSADLAFSSMKIHMSRYLNWFLLKDMTQRIFIWSGNENHFLLIGALSLTTESISKMERLFQFFNIATSIPHSNVLLSNFPYQAKLLS